MLKTKLSENQIKLIVGSLLGDGYLVKTTSGYALRINHSIFQKDYADYKYSLISNIVHTPPKIIGKTYQFRTVSHPIFKQFRNKFYYKNLKIVSKDFLEQYLNGFVLAIWIMDDGTRESNSIRINSQGFTKNENIYLIKLLQAKLGIKTTLNKDKDKFRLRIKTESIKKVLNLIQPYIIPSMLYKLPL